MQDDTVAGDGVGQGERGGRGDKWTPPQCMQIVARIMANSQKTTANKTTTSITLQPRDSPAGDGLEKLYLEQSARGKGGTKADAHA